jgi:RNA polymerase sigma factor (sigma-70 family)
LQDCKCFKTIVVNPYFKLIPGYKLVPVREDEGVPFRAEVKVFLETDVIDLGGADLGKKFVKTRVVNLKYFLVTFLATLRYINRVSSFRSFYKKYKDKFFAYLMRSTGDYYLSSDILQESFTRYLERYGNDEQSVSLLYTIGRNLVFDAARKQSRNPSLEIDQEISVTDNEHHFMVREEYRRVLAAMQQLDEVERDILALAVSSDLSYREISMLTGFSEANVKVKIHRTRVKLRKIIQAGE